jgi:hypothetical protein
MCAIKTDLLNRLGLCEAKKREAEAKEEQRLKEMLSQKVVPIERELTEEEKQAKLFFEVVKSDYAQAHVKLVPLRGNEQFIAIESITHRFEKTKLTPQFIEDMRINGQTTPILIVGNNKLGDGNHRLNCLEQLGVHYIRFYRWYQNKDRLKDKLKNTTAHTVKHQVSMMTYHF